MTLLSPTKRRSRLDQWEIERRLKGFHAVASRTMHQIARGINTDNAHVLPPVEWKEHKLNIIDKIWAARLWIELNIQLMR